jgi:HEAT repeat protein
LIAVSMAVLLCAVVLMTHEDQTPESLLVALKKSPPSKRWQKAFELSNEINRDPQKVRDPAVHRQMIQVLRDSDRFDAKTRSYMAIALSQARSHEALEALLEALDDPEEEVRIYALWSLGRSGHSEAAGRVETLLDQESPQMRKTAAYVLGALGSTQAVPALERVLNDPVEDVRWNAALALARVGSASGYEVLLSMLDRPRLSSDLDLNDAQIEGVMTNALKGLALIQRPESIKILETLSKQDKNMKVRQGAMDALSHLGRNSA